MRRRLLSTWFRRSSMLVTGLILVVTSVAGLTHVSDPAHAAPLFQPTLGIIPGSGPAGLTVTATGSGWTPSNGPYTIRWEHRLGTELGSFTPNGSGSWSTSITIPTGAGDGAHTIVACEGYSGTTTPGEFEQCANSTYTVVSPTATMTPIPSLTSTPTVAPGITPNTPTFTATHTPTVTPISGCIDGITRISPTNSDDLGGAATTDLVMEVTIGDSETLVRVYTSVWAGGTGFEEVFTQWPDPLPGTTVDAVPSSTDGNRWTLTIHDYPLRLGYNQIKVDMHPTCWSGGRTYYQFRNGIEPSPTPRPDACGGLGLPAGATILTFDWSSTDSYVARVARENSVRFERSLQLLQPDGINPRSAYGVGASIEAMEFGSAMLPIRMAFDRPLTALGLFVGMQEAVWVSGEITAVLSAWGYRGGGGELTRLGADSTTFPAAASDVIHCLRFDAAPGDLIARAQVEYLDSAGVSIAERRLIDDLTIVYADADLPPDQPPVVEISSPTEGSTVAGTTVHLRASIREDRELIRVNYQIDGGPETPLGASPSVTDPTSYFTGVNFSAASLNDGFPHLLTITAFDSAGQHGTDTVTITVPTPVPTLDIQAVKMEVVQTVQCLDNPACLDNAVPILIGKPTWVRLYVRAEGGPPSRPVSGRLCRGRAATCEDGPILPINRISPDEDDDPSVNDRGDLSASLNFIIPPAWLTEGPLELTAFVNYQEEDVDEILYDNNIAQASVSVIQPRSLTVMFMPVTADGITAPLSEMWSFIDWLARVYPVSRVTPVGRAPLSGNFDLSDSSGDGCGRSWSRLMDALRAAYSWSGVGQAYLYGIVPEEAERDGVAGCGERPGRVASGRTSVGSRWGAVVAAQELGHNFGRRHAPGCDAGNSDGSYPRRGALLDEWGIDLALRQIYPMASSFDYMGYCGAEGNSWTSVYTYLSLLSGLPVAGSPSGLGVLAAPYRADGENMLVGGGTISPDSFSLERGFYRASLAEGITDGLPLGPYSVQLQDAAGGILFTRDFNVIELSNHDPTDAGHVQLILPDLAGATQIVFLYDGEEIGRVSASANAPQVQIVEPVGGEDWNASGAHTIVWQASDGDDDSLRFNVQYSEDAGASWTSIAFDLTDVSALSVDSADLPGGELLFRVLASDGWNTAMSATSSPVSVANKPPMIHLASPMDGDFLPAGEAIVFRGYATDFEDIIVEDSAFLWTSSRDGDLGRAPTLWGVPLSDGEHQITFTVTDSDGQTASQSVMIRIGQPEPERATIRPAAIAMVACGAAILIMTFVTGAVVMVRRSRRRQ